MLQSKPHHKHQRSWSFSFENNRLTKRMYSLSETTLTRTPLASLKKLQQSKPSTNATDCSKPKPYRSFLKTFHSRFEPLREVDTPTPKSSYDSRRVHSYQSLTQPPPTKPKFTLLKRLNRDASLRPRPEIRILDNRMKKWETVNKNLQKLMPQPIVKPEVRIPIKPKPIITVARVKEVTEDLVKYLEHFWNIYQNDESMTSYLKNTDGFTLAVQEVLMKDGVIRRISDPECVYKHFQIFLKEDERSQDYATKDLQLHSALQYYSIKMEQKARVCHKDFSDQLKHRAQLQLSSLQTKIEEAERTNHWQHIDTMRFLASKRLYLPGFSHESSLNELEELGMKFNVKERMRDKVLSERERINYGLRDTLDRFGRPPKFKVVNRLFGRRG